MEMGIILIMKIELKIMKMEIVIMTIMILPTIMIMARNTKRINADRELENQANE